MTLSRWTPVFAPDERRLSDDVLPAMSLNEPVMGLVLAEVIESVREYQVSENHGPIQLADPHSQ